MVRRPVIRLCRRDAHQRSLVLLLTVAVAIAHFLLRDGPCAADKARRRRRIRPAAGVAAGSLIALGPRARWPGGNRRTAATIAPDPPGRQSVGSAVVFAVRNAGETLIIAALIDRYFGVALQSRPAQRRDRVPRCGGGGNRYSGVGGTLGFLFHNSTAPILTTWYHSFTSDGLGVVTVAPLLIGLRASVRDPPSHREMFEGAERSTTLIVLSAALIFLPRERWATPILAIAAPLPLLLWRGTLPPWFSPQQPYSLVSLTIVCTTTFGIGIFGDANFPVAERILSAQAAALAVSLCSYVLAALFEERRRHEAMLTESEARLQEALTAGGVAAFDWEVSSDHSRRSDNAPLILGFDAKEKFGGAEFFARVHPNDQSRLLDQIRDLHPDRPILDSTFRFIRKDGREIWLEQTAKAEFELGRTTCTDAGADTRYYRSKAGGTASRPARLPNSITASKTCSRALPLSPSRRAREATQWTTSSNRWTGAFSPWPPLIRF